MNKNKKIIIGIFASILILCICLCLGGWIVLHLGEKVLEKTMISDNPDPTKAKDLEKTIIEYGLPYCSQVSQFVGIKVICQVDRVYCSYKQASTGHATFCTDALSPNDKFTLTIWDEDWSYMDGDCIIIKGPVSMFNKKPEIVFVPSRVNVSPCKP